jgi:hypothetical protein
MEVRMRDTVHVPTLVRWLKDLSTAKTPSTFQLTEAWQIAQTLHGIRYPVDQENLDNVRRDIVSYLARSDNLWSSPPKVNFDPHSHMIVPSRHRLRSWTEIDLTPELSWSLVIAGRTVPNKLVKALKTALGKQHANLKLLLYDNLDLQD